jgi:uncharacterized protein
MSDVAFFFVGLATGAVGTLVGAGGGFLLAPLFIFLFPTIEPARLTALSLLAVAANSLSGCVGYAVRRKVHWPSVLVFSAMGIPGVYLGVELSQLIPRQLFETVFAVFLFTMCTFVFWRSFRARKDHHDNQFWNKRSIVLGGLISVFIGVLSSLLGIGGGIVHVPLLSEVLNYPIHFAAGTSHSILAITSVVAVITHYFKGDLNNLESFVPYLVVGLVIGAQGGAAISKKVHGRWILRVLAIALFSVAVRLLIKNF